MPRGDKTGPRGDGPMTGRGAGFCGGAGYPGHANRGIGIGSGRWKARALRFGRGGAGGCGYRHRYFETGMPGWMRSIWFDEYGESTEGAPVNREGEVALLKKQAASFESALEDIHRRLESLQDDEDE